MNSSTNDEMVPFVLPYKSNSGTNCTSMDPIFQLVHGKDFVSMMRAVFKAKLFFPIAEVYRYTRTYELGLSMADYLIETLNDCSQQTTTDERNNWMAHFLVLRLTMLDYLNQWQEYIICFDQVTKALETGQLGSRSFVYAPFTLVKISSTPHWRASAMARARMGWV